VCQGVLKHCSGVETRWIFRRKVLRVLLDVYAEGGARIRGSRLGIAIEDKGYQEVAAGSRAKIAR
jgi:hypothetical protein